MSELDEELNRLEDGEAWEETDEVVQLAVKRTLDKVIPVRLSGDKWEELRTEARELGIGPTTLARMWILERLRQKTTYLIQPRAVLSVADAPQNDEKSGPTRTRRQR